MHPKIKYEWILSTQHLLLRDLLLSLQGNSHLQHDKKKCIHNNMKMAVSCEGHGDESSCCTRTAGWLPTDASTDTTIVLQQMAINLRSAN